MTYRCIAQLQEKADNTALLCRLLGVSRSGFYAAGSRRGEPARVCPTSTHLRAAFTASGRCYGTFGRAMSIHVAKASATEWTRG